MYCVRIRGAGETGSAVAGVSVSLAEAFSKALESWEIKGEAAATVQIISEHLNLDIIPTGETLAFLSWPRLEDDDQVDDDGGEG